MNATKAAPAVNSSVVLEEFSANSMPDSFPSKPLAGLPASSPTSESAIAGLKNDQV